MSEVGFCVKNTFLVQLKAKSGPHTRLIRETMEEEEEWDIFIENNWYFNFRAM